MIERAVADWVRQADPMVKTLLWGSRNLGVRPMLAVSQL